MKRKTVILFVAAMSLLSVAMPVTAQQTSPVKTDEVVSVCRAQIPMATMGNKWNILRRSGIAGMPDEMLDMYTYEYKAEGTASFNGKEYVLITGSTTATNVPPAYPVYLREDMETGIVYKLVNGEERLMFDYNLKEGDTFDTFCGLVNEIEGVVYSVSKIEQQQIAGMMRRVYTIQAILPDFGKAHIGQYTWIEGIGGSEGFYLTPIAPGSIPQELICFADTEGHQYVKYPDQGCNIYQNSLHGITTANEVRVYAESGKIRVVCPVSAASNTVKVYTVGGELLSQVVSSSSEIVITLPKEYTQEFLIVNVNNKYNTKVNLK